MKTAKAINECFKWLKYCIEIGFNKKNINELDKLWWKLHDNKGNLKRTSDITNK